MQSKTITYKNTNNDFVPLIPDHWEILKAKNLGVFQGSTVDKKIVKGEKPVRMVNFTDVYGNEKMEINDDIDFMKVTAKDSQYVDFNVKIGDMLFTPSSEIREDIGQSALVKYEASDLVFSYHLVRLSFTRNVFDNYKKYLFNNKASLQYFTKVCKGSTRKILSRGDFKNLPVFLPPFEEQVKIANYLDVKCEQINQFIADKKQLINLLKEQRQSVIDDYFFGIKTIVKLKYLLTKMGSGVTPKGGANVYKQSGIYFLRSQNIHNDGLRLDNVAFITKDVHRNMFSSQIQKNDVLINITGASIGRCYVYLLEEEANINQHICILRPDLDLIIPEFLMYQIQSTRIQNLIDMVEGASREGLTNFVLKNYPIAITDIEEQKNIVSNIKNDIKIIDETIAKTEEELKLVTEYKEALISNAVTGQIQLT